MNHKFLFQIIVITILFTSCSNKGYVKLNYPQAPIAYFPEGVHSIVIVNRSLTKDEDKKGNVIEAITSGEVAGSDRLASDECIRGVIDGAQELNGIQMVISQNSHIYGTGTRETPELLDWQYVEDVCEESQADVLLVLETFDSNSDLLINTATHQINTILSGNVPKPAVPANVRMNVLSYWRMYDPVSRSIVDQYQHTSFMNFETVGGVPPMTALSETAYFAGQEYIFRFLPTYYTVKRELYKKAKGKNKNEFASGWRRAEVANWNEAIEIWEDLVEKSKPKTAGRACLNIAVAYEVLGDTEKALQWAQRSYQDYDDELGRDYAKTLLRRQKIEN